MFLSLVIPTRGRVEGLLRTLESVRAGRPREGFEILIMVDNDDVETLAVREQLEKDHGRYVMVTPRMGYMMMDRYYLMNLEQHAAGEFVWFGGDDMLVEGDWWGEMQKVPKTGYIVQPECSQLGMSVYYKAEGQAFPIIPRQCWKEYSDEFPTPLDLRVHELLTQNGWKTWFLEGVTFWHDRPDELEIFRADPQRGVTADMVDKIRELEAKNLALETDVHAQRLRLETEAAMLREQLHRESGELRDRLHREYFDLRERLLREAAAEKERKNFEYKSLLRSRGFRIP